MEPELLTILTDYLDSTTYPLYMNLADRAKLRKQAQNYLLREGKLYKITKLAKTHHNGSFQNKKWTLYCTTCIRIQSQDTSE
jgi:hypothetical protein